MAVFSPLSGRLSDRIEPRRIASAGMAITAIGLFFLVFIGTETSNLLIVLILALLGFGFALFSSPNMNAIMSAVERRYLGIASGTVATMRLLGQMNGAHELMAGLLYGAGLRLMECVRLRVQDVDFVRREITVRQGKGGKDRYTILSKTTLECLREYWRAYRPKDWLFEGQKEGSHICYTSIRNIFVEARERAGITKPVGPHSLRHAFATHLIEAGTSLHHVQLLLGHKSPKTTTVYLHVSKMNLAQVCSPLDSIPEEI